MSGACRDCKHWVRKRVRRYGDGTEVVLYEAQGAAGHCDALDQETAPEFGCRGWAVGNVETHVETVAGAPWQNFEIGPCPDCNNGRDGGVCHRCQGTRQVRHYADGYIGEERTRRHPLEPQETPRPAPVFDGDALAPLPRASVL